MVDHRPQRVLRADVEVGPDAGRAVPARRRSTRRASATRAGVRYCGDGIERPFSSVKRSAPYIGASRPVTQTSPSPWQPCASPQLNIAPGDLDREVQRRALRTSWRVSMLPPKVPGGMTGCALAPAGQTPIVPKNGASGIAMSSRKA